MGKKKQPFIDKKNSSTFHLLHRSQRDVGGNDNGQSTTILWPSPNNKSETNDAVLLTRDHDEAKHNSSSSRSSSKLMKWKEEMSKVNGLLVDDDEYDYNQHMKPITGTGDYFDANTGHRSDGRRDARTLSIMNDDEVLEVDRQLESIALTSNYMDDDIAHALFSDDFDDVEYEEIQDDFCLIASQEPTTTTNDTTTTTQDDFDYDEHIKQLMERAKKEQSRNKNDMTTIPSNHQAGKEDYNFFSRVKPLHEKDDEDDDNSGHFDVDAFLYEEEQQEETTSAALNHDEEKALRRKFEETLAAEYDTDEEGDLEEEEIYGTFELEGNAQVENALNEFLTEKKDDVFIQGTKHLPEYRRTGGSAFQTIQQEDDEPQDDDDDIQKKKQDIKETLRQAKEFLASPELDLPPEEILIDGKSYFSQATRNPWDCESILTTYSNLDNNPVVIDDGGPRRGRRKKKNNNNKNASEESSSAIPQIKLSNKTGLPLGVLEQQQQDDDDWATDTLMSVNKGEKRNKKETKAEKKLRKMQVKQEKQIARIQKKLMKEAFADEFMKRNGEACADDVTGKSVFRFS